MEQYKIDEELKLEKRVYITKKVKAILRKQRAKQGISMAKIVCNLIIKEYGNDN